MPGSNKTIVDCVVALLAKNKVVFGSDVYAAYTFEYVWGANQFGHVLIGLFPGLLFVWLTGNSPWGALIVIGVYALKETVDYLIAVRLVENVFKPNVREALLDGVVDWCFVAWGAFIAAAVGRVVEDRGFRRHVSVLPADAPLLSARKNLVRPLGPAEIRAPANVPGRLRFRRAEDRSAL